MEYSTGKIINGLNNVNINYAAFLVAGRMK